MIEKDAASLALVELAQRSAPEEAFLTGAAGFEVVPSQPDDAYYVKERNLSGEVGYVSPPESAIMGDAAVRVTPVSITLRFTAHDGGSAETLRSRYGVATRIRSADGRWEAVRVARTGPAAQLGTDLFDCALLVTRGAPGTVAATRVILAGGAFSADATVGGRSILLRPLSADVASHHDRRLALVADGALSDQEMADLARAAGFVCGVELATLRVERYDRAGVLLETEDRRWAPRVGWLPHSPFTSISASAQAQAFACVAVALHADDDRGFPLRHILDQITASYTVRDIHLAAQLLAQALTTAAYHASHGRSFDGTATAPAEDLRRLNEQFDLRLQPADLARLERVRNELLEAGFFHEPGYESGRPQRDIKFVRDVVDTLVLRWCRYSGAFHGSESAAVLELPPERSYNGAMNSAVVTARGNRP